MANPTSKLDLVVNGVTTSYDIHDANAIPRDGGAVITGTEIGRTVNDSRFYVCGGTSTSNGASVSLYGKDHTSFAGYASLKAQDNSNYSQMIMQPNGSLTLDNNGTPKNIAMREDTVPRSGGAVMTGDFLGRNVSISAISIGGGTGLNNGASVSVFGKDHSTAAGYITFRTSNGSTAEDMLLQPNGTWTWTGQPCQTSSDQRLKQQITEIDDKLLDAWESVELVQFKYNDAVDEKGDNARLHTGYVVQQIQKACESHGVNISQYGLFCHEEYPQETEEVEVERADGTKTKERKVIREASEHYSLRYTEALIVECKYLRRCVERLTARIEQLEKEREASK